MHVKGSRVGIIGGSIAGCSAAIALERLGCQVEVFERSSGTLRDRGSGIAAPLALRDELIEAGYLPAGYPSCEMAWRHWFIADGSPGGRRLWEQPNIAAMNNWGVLWRSLRASVPDARYHDGTAVTEVRRDADGQRVTIRFGDGSCQIFDVVIGADGYRSEVRTALHPASQATYSGYVLWRGNFAETALSDRALIDRLDSVHAWLTVCFDGGTA